MTDPTRQTSLREPVLDHDPALLGADLRLVPAVVFAWGTAWSGVLATARLVLTVVTAIGVTTVIVVLVGARYRRSRTRRLDAALFGAPSHRRARRREQLAAQLGIITAAVITIGLSTGTQLWLTRTELSQLVARGVVADVEATVISDPRPVASRWSSGSSSYLMTVRAHRVEARAPSDYAGSRTRLDVGAELTVIAPASWAHVQLGEHLRTWGRLGPEQPGRRAVGTLRPGTAPEVTAPSAWWWRSAEVPRSALRQSVSGLPGPGAGLLPSLVVGDTSLLTDAVTADLETAGLTHLTAVSGANVAIVLGALLAIAAMLGATPRWRLLIAGGGLVGFVMLARPEPSVVRAAAMGAIGLRALVFSRRHDVLPILNVAVLALLMWDPWLARRPGFALSVAATAALILVAPGWYARLRRRMPAAIALPLAATCAAQAGCAPILVLLQPSLSTVSVPANLLAGPAVFPATVLGALAAGFGVIDVGLARPFAVLGWVATTWIAGVAHVAATLPGAVVPWFPGPPGAVLMVLSVALVVLTVRRIRPTDPARLHRARSHRSPARLVVTRCRVLLSRFRSVGASASAKGSSRSRRSARALVAVGLVSVLVIGFWVRRPGNAEVDPRWAVAMCNVGQGDATVLRSGANRGVLIDAGPDAELMDACLRRLKITSLDAVLLSHFHADHVLGLAGALRGRQVRHVVLAPLQAPQFGVDSVRTSLAGHAGSGTPLVETARDAAHATVGESDWSVAWTLVLPLNVAVASSPDSARYPGAETDSDGTTINESSVVVWATVSTPDGARIVVAALGDLEEEGQRALMTRLPKPAGVDPVVDVVKVAHHGSRHQEAALYQSLDPAVALVGVGRNNDYGHPAPSALRMLHDVGAVVERSDQAGLITIAAMGSGDRPDLVVATD